MLREGDLPFSDLKTSISDEIKLGGIEVNFELIQLVVDREHVLVQRAIGKISVKGLYDFDFVIRMDLTHFGPLLQELQRVVQSLGVVVVHILGVGGVLQVLLSRGEISL